MKTTSLILAAFVAIVSASIGYAADEPTPPPEVLKELRYFVGDWNLEGEIGGKPINGNATIRAVPGEDCIVGTVSFARDGRRSSFTFVDGWDSSTGWFTENGVASDGTVYTLRWTRKRPGSLEGKLVGTINGKATTGIYTSEQISEDRFSVSGVETIGDESVEWKLDYSRIPKT